MAKKTISLIMIVVLLLVPVFTVQAANVSLNISLGGACTVTVSQGGNTQTYTSSSTFTADDAAGDVSISVSGVAVGNYATIAGNTTPRSTATVSPSSGTVSIAIKEFVAPNISVTTNTSTGGLDYSVTSSGLSNLTYTVTLGSYTSSSERGTIPLSSSVIAGQPYTVTVTASIAGYTSKTGSASATAGSASAGYALTAKASEGGNVGGSVTGNYASGAKVTLSATASSGYKFYNWTSSNGGTFADATKSDTTFTMPGNATTITANFKKAYAFVITRNEGGKVWDVDGNYFEGETVRVSATPDKGYVFDNWVSSAGGTFADSKAASTTFTMPANAATVTATFKKDPNSSSSDDSGDSEEKPEEEGLFELKTSASEGGNVVVNQNRAKEGQQVTVRANAKAGYRFDGWSSEGGGSFTDAKATATTFTMPAGNVTIIASFVPDDGSGTNSGDSTDGDDGKNGDKDGGNGIIWLIIAIAGVLIAVVAGILLMMNEKKKRAAGDDGFDDYEDNSGGYTGGGYSNTANTQEIERPVVDRGTRAKNPKPRKTKKKDTTKFRAEDWDD